MVFDSAIDPHFITYKLIKLTLISVILCHMEKGTITFFSLIA